MKVVLFFVSALILFPLPIFALAQAAPGNAPARTRPQDMPADLWAAFKDQSSLEGLCTIGAAGILFAFVRPQDKRVQAAVGGSPSPVSVDLARTGAWLGDGAVLFPAMGVVYGAGWLWKDEAFVETGAEGLEALALAGVEADILKYAARRERPDGSDRYSFPSGHAAEAFAVAAVLGSQFAWPAEIPAYLAGGFVGYSRLQENKHWLSDVIAGAGLGVLSGRAVWRVHSHQGRGVTLSPWIAPGLVGANMALRI